jgi:hypothetical protein
MQALRFLDGFPFPLKIGKPKPKVMLYLNLMRRDRTWNDLVANPSLSNQSNVNTINRTLNEQNKTKIK